MTALADLFGLDIQLTFSEGGMGVSPILTCGPSAVILLSAGPGFIGIMEPPMADVGHFIVVSRSGPASPDDPAPYSVREGRVSAEDATKLTALLQRSSYPGRDLDVKGRLTTADYHATTDLQVRVYDAGNDSSFGKTTVTCWCAGYEGPDARFFAAIVHLVSSIALFTTGDDHMQHLADSGRTSFP